jgi:vancomycin permeability regulator SanA
MSAEYYFDKCDRFTIENYNDKKPFSSFLPGVAGVKGTPMWSFYINRGQAICSFGIKDKNSPIMEFFPAYKCYQTVDYIGFRTFIKILKEDKVYYYEPFSSIAPDSKKYNRMYIGANECEIEEVNRDGSLQTNVLYFTLPGESIAALVRKTTVTNLSKEEIELEILDGMPAVIPFGLDNSGLKEVGHTLKAWMSAYNLENGVPFYKLRASAGDTAEVSSINEGHFYLTFAKDNDREVLLKPIVDADVVFGSNTSLSYPANFVSESLESLYEKKQIVSNKVPSGFFGVDKILKAGESIEIYSFIGHADSIETIEELKVKLVSSDYVMNKYNEAKILIRNLTEDIATNTSSKLFDEYCRQNYLDNLLRGGYPLLVKGGEEPFIYHVYSRKHGDIERDYNFFTTEPEYFSSGNGNYRDVNQNRRCDVLFHPEVKDFNVKTFMDLIQIDGYNPLAINGYRFLVKKSSEKTFLNTIEEQDRYRVESFLSKPFTLGKLYKLIENEKIKLSTDTKHFVDKVIEDCEQVMEAVHGEGYWSDHWTYNLDLIENYLTVYPDKKKELLLEKEKYTYFDNSVFVRPRSERYVLTNRGVRQYEAVVHDAEKEAFIKARAEHKNVMRKDNGNGEVYKSNLLSKLVTLAANKFSILDPMGMGIEMEGGKPGWDDAMNGLPGIFGSSMAESYELQRLLNFIVEVLNEYEEQRVHIPVEVKDLLLELTIYIDEFNNSQEENKDYLYWDKVCNYREGYREKIKYGISEEVYVNLSELKIIIEKLAIKLQKAVERAIKDNNNIPPTFFYYEAVDYEKLYDENGIEKQSKNKLPLVRVNKFIQNKLPLFLEGVVRALKVFKHEEASKIVYEGVKNSGLFDSKLNMYKLNESLEEESIEIGRVRAFTRGWLENETIWLHMEYKYILEILNNGLYEEFFSDFKNVMVPFFDAETYGRSPLENCSFIASSANPDETTHGGGFVARLSGAAAEFLSIWNVMMAGHKPFYMKEDMLCLELKPVLPSWLFDGDNKVRFNFLGRTKLTYINPNRRNTYDEFKVKSIVLSYKDESLVKISERYIVEPYSKDIRDGKVESITINLD